MKNKSKTGVLELFPTSLYQASLGAGFAQIQKDLLVECYQTRELDEDGRKWSEKNYRGGYTSYGTLSQLHQMSSTCEALKRKIDSHVNRFAKHLELDLQGGRLQMTSFWVNIMGANCQHSFHLHPLSVLSGTIYIQTPPKSSGLKVEDPRIAGFMSSPPVLPKSNLSRQRYVTLEPRAGDLILFESWLKHEVPPHQGTKDRISYSFNYDWV